MLKKTGKFLFTCIITATILFPSKGFATSITLKPGVSEIFIGDNLNINIMADIDPTDAIIAFGFDNNLSGTATLAYDGFVMNALLFADDPFFGPNDIDGIYGVSQGNYLFGAPVSGKNIFLGTLSYKAMTSGNAIVSLGADDLNTWFTEGLIPANVLLPNFMPDITPAQVNIKPIPEPATLFLLGSGLIGLIGSRKRKIECSNKSAVTG